MCFSTPDFQPPPTPAAAPPPPVPGATEVKKRKPTASGNTRGFSLRIPRSGTSGIKL